MTAPALNRRDFVRIGLAVGGGLLVTVGATGCAPGADLEPVTFSPNAFLRIDPDGAVTVVSKHLEMGQGTYTGLATIVAEELDADWAQVEVEAAPGQTPGALRPGLQGVAKIDIERRALAWVLGHDAWYWLRMALWRVFG